MTFRPDRVESAIARVEALPDAAARDAAREAVTAVLEFHREALRRLSGRLRAANAEGDDLLRTIAGDELVASLLSLHGVHPPPLDLVPVERLTGKHQGKHQRCDLCGERFASEHAHLFDAERRRLNCVCTACGVLFDSNAKNLRPVRPKALRLDRFRITDALWDALKVPVGLAFFSHSSALGAVVAAYPGPAGAIESTVSPAAWQALVQDNTALALLEPDVSALLVDRLSATPRYYLLSIDECYRLTGLVRSRWQGLTGGDGPLRAIDEFFGTLTADKP
jgi:hypothetical protein